MASSFNDRLIAAIDKWIFKHANSSIAGIVSVFSAGFKANKIQSPSFTEIAEEIQKCLNKRPDQFDNQDQLICTWFIAGVEWACKYVEKQQEEVRL